MTANMDLEHVLRSISARMSIIEVAIAAIAPTNPVAQTRTVATFDALAQELLDQYLGMQVDETYIDLLRCSINDVRHMLAVTAQ